MSHQKICEFVATHRSLKTGEEYMIVGVAEWKRSGLSVVVFRSINGFLFAFSMSEFSSDFEYLPGGR